MGPRSHPSPALVIHWVTVLIMLFGLQGAEDLWEFLKGKGLLPVRFPGKQTQRWFSVQDGYYGVPLD